MNCGCKVHIEVDWDVGETTDSFIEFCPLHVSAEKLQEAADQALLLLDMLITTTAGEHKGSIRDLLVTALAASRGEAHDAG